VAALSSRDAERLFRFVADVEELGEDDPFARNVLDELAKLVPADWITYCEQDRVRQRVRYGVRWPGADWGDRPAAVSYWDIADEHPVCSWHNRGDARALKLSDFLGIRQLRRTRVYALWFRPANIERELSVPIPSPPWHTKTFLFARRPGRDFTERDRLLLNLLQPHLSRLWRAGQTRRQLQAAMAGLEWASERDARGVILLAPDGRIEFASPAARRLVGAYFGASLEAELPPVLARWWESRSLLLAERLTDHRLTVKRSGNALLLEETWGALLRLTARERQILAWLARGKTNQEIAEILWIAPTTVRKHLESLYAKLGVRTRTAAATRFLGALDQED
jgi:DNA-binding CsgD family transcriptional regulator